MNSVLESVLANAISLGLSTLVGFILFVFGINTQTTVIVAAAVLFGVAILFLIGRKYYPRYKRKRTERLLEQALSVKENETDEEKVVFKTKIVERVLLENAGVQLQESSSVLEFLNQEACEPHIKEAAHNAKNVRTLTIRGEKYFLGPNSYLHHLCTSKRSKDSTIEVLVLSPDSRHISDELATNLDHESAKEIKDKMRIVLEYLIHLTNRVKNFEVKCYDERPNFKILMFDDVMFVSSFAGGGPKNDRAAKMLQIKRDGNPLFVGFERLIDDLSRRSISLSKEVVGRV